MKTAYRREMKHNYLILEPEENGFEGYEVHMMEANRIEGLLKFRVKQVDNRKFYYYEITSKQPLNRVLEYRSLGGEELGKLIRDIGQTLDRLEVYLLEEEQILLEPEYIYVEPEQFTVSLCLVPGRRRAFPGEMTELLRYLLGKVNHQDKECVVMAYGLYQESLKENYGMKNLLQIAGKNCSERKKDDEILPQQKTEHNPEKSPVSPPPYLPIEAMEERESSFDFDVKEKVTVFIIPMLAMAGMAAALWLILGVEGVWRFWYGVPCIGIFSAFTVLAIRKKEPGHLMEPGERRARDNRQPAERFDWQMIFEEETEEKEPERETGGGEVLQTALLTEEGAGKNIRCLRAVNTDTEDIAITYVPYLIGKQEGLVDCVLTGEGVSRIHARIDREGEEYQISDLNSTNGTSINGKTMETNETVTLKKGDEVSIANISFIFT